MTVPAIFLVDRCGRTILLKIGAIGMTFCIWLLGIAGEIDIVIPSSCPTSATNDKYDCAHSHGYPDGHISGGISATVIVSVLGFVCFFAVSWGPIIWAFCAEIFPNKYRAKGVAITTCCNWIGNTIVGYVTPIMLDSIGFATFYFYGTFCIICVVFAFWIVETAQVSLEHMTPLWEKKLHAKYHSGSFEGSQSVGSVKDETTSGSTRITLPEITEVDEDIHSDVSLPNVDVKEDDSEFSTPLESPVKTELQTTKTIEV
jgi:MFS family permease